MVSAIISAILAIGGTIVTSVLSEQDAREANANGLALANQKRQDELKLTEKQEKFAKEKAALDKKSFMFQVSEANKDRAEKAEERIYNRQQQQQANFFSIINKNTEMRDSLLNIFPGIRD